MLLGSLVDLGVEIGLLREKLSRLPLKGYTIAATTVTRQGIAGTKLDVRVGRGHVERGWKEIRKILDAPDLDDAVRVPALSIFRRLIEVEARIHRVSVDKVHL